ncbi:hypothetical protein BG004_006270 [Podila humilis]|nr:hypothetical protein BG004_006270 [Podila humilis]
MTNPTTHDNTKPSTVETIKEKAANLVHKVTGKPTAHFHDQTHMGHNKAYTDQDQHHHSKAHDLATNQDKPHIDGSQVDHSKVNPSAFLSSTRFGGESNPAAANAAAINSASLSNNNNNNNTPFPVVTQPESSHIPAHSHNVAPGTGLASVAPHGEQHASPLHKTDDPQLDVIHRVVGDAPRDPNNLEAAHIKPVM